MKITSTLIALSAASLTSAQNPASYDAGDNVSYQISIPQSTAQSGSGDFYFQMMGPTTNSWIAMGMGSQVMMGASIFVMYADGAGNVTVSPRLGKGNFEPEVNPQAKVELLEGSGVVGNMMVANVRCTDCTTWEDGSIDFTSSSADFIWAKRSGAALDSTDENEELVQHQNNGDPFTFNLAQATGGEDTVNPFTTTGGSSSGSGSGSGNSGASSQGSSSEGGSSQSNLAMILKAHGIIMGLTVVLLIPLGALLVRLPVAVPWWAHGALQVLFLALFTAGWGLGYHFADNSMLLFEGEGFTHTVFGTVLLAFWWLQPFLGLAHHILFKKKGGRTAVSHAHIWWGRILMILSIINGGLGLQLAANTKGGEIAYGVVAGVMFVVYVVVAGMGEMRKRKSRSGVAGEK